jgi:hypothetical protein
MGTPAPQTGTRRGARFSDWLVPALGLAAMAMAGYLYQNHPRIYFDIFDALIINPYKIPFIDTQQVPALVECWRHGIDVYKTAPCDPLHRVFAYSPLFLRAIFLPAWSNWMGLLMDGLCFLSLALLPVPQWTIGRVGFVLALFSSMPVFTLERGNMDVVIFVLVAAGGWLFLGSLPARLCGYGFLALAGLLKFYPLVLFILFLRERTALLCALCLVAAALLSGFVWYFHGELVEMTQNLPPVSNFTDGFGSRQFAGGLPTVLQGLLESVGAKTSFIPALSNSGQFSLGCFLLQLAFAAAAVVRLATSGSFNRAIARQGADENCFLVIGAAIMVSCFFIGQNVNYRGIHFLFVLPGVLALATSRTAPRARALFIATAAAILFVMWGMALQQAVAELSGGVAYPLGGSAAVYIFWIVREVAWWWIIVVLLAVLLRFVAQSAAWNDAGASLRGLSGRPHRPDDPGNAAPTER